MKPAEDSEQVLHARQAIAAYEHARGIGNTIQALEHLKRAMDCLMSACFAVEDDIAKVRKHG